MSSPKKIVLVTGSNKGIGYNLLRHVGMTKGFDAIMTYRSNKLEAEKAIGVLKHEGVIVKKLYHLDVTKKDSRQALFKSISKEFGKIDVLVNNSGLAKPQQWIDDNDHSKGKLEDPSPQAAVDMYEINYFATMAMTELFLPIVTRAVVFTSSQGGLLSGGGFMGMNADMSEGIRKAFLETDKLEDIQQLYENYIKDRTNNDMTKYPKNNFCVSYSMTKSSLNSYIRMKSKVVKNVALVAFCPGWCKTDLGTDAAPYTAEYGSMIGAWCSLEADFGFTGKFFINGRQNLKGEFWPHKVDF